jgi:hypothetical protein
MLLDTDTVNEFIHRYVSNAHLGDDAIDHATAALCDAMENHPTLDTCTAIHHLYRVMDAYVATQTTVYPDGRIVTPSVRHYQRLIVAYLAGEIKALPTAAKWTPMQRTLRNAIGDDLTELADLAKWFAPSYVPSLAGRYPDEWQDAIAGVDWRAVARGILAAWATIGAEMEELDRQAGERRREAWRAKQETVAA